MAQGEPYPSDLKEQEWNIISKLLPAGGKLGRPPRYEKRDILNAIPYPFAKVALGEGCRTIFTLPHSLLLFRQVAARGSVGAHQSCVEGSSEGCRRKKQAPSAVIIPVVGLRINPQPPSESRI